MGLNQSTATTIQFSVKEVNTIGGSRTHTKQGLNLLPLPIGLRWLGAREGFEPPTTGYEPDMLPDYNISRQNN